MLRSLLVKEKLQHPWSCDSKSLAVERKVMPRSRWWKNLVGRLHGAVRWRCLNCWGGKIKAVPCQLSRKPCIFRLWILNCPCSPYGTDGAWERTLPSLDRAIRSCLRSCGRWVCKRNPSRGCIMPGNLPSCSTNQCCLFCYWFDRVCIVCFIKDGTCALSVSEMNKACLVHRE